MGGTQLWFSDYELSTAKMPTMLEKSLAEIDMVVPWQELNAQNESQFPRPAGMVAGRCHSSRSPSNTGQRPPGERCRRQVVFTMPPDRDGWISDGHQVLHFRPGSDARWNQALEITVGELMPGGEPPLLKRRMELRREDAIRLWRQKRQQGWRPCLPQWTPPPEGKPPARRATNTMEASANRPCF